MSRSRFFPTIFINLFISDAWNNLWHDITLQAWITNTSWQININNCQANVVFKIFECDKLISKEANQLKIQDSHILIIPEHTYFNYDECREYEIEEAKKSGKPILAVIPSGKHKIYSSLAIRMCDDSSEANKEFFLQDDEDDDYNDRYLYKKSIAQQIFDIWAKKYEHNFIGKEVHGYKTINYYRYKFYRKKNESRPPVWKCTIE